MAGCVVWRAMACSGMEWLGRREQQGSTIAGRRDKSGSPLETQAIGMAWVRPCRSVGARAARDAFANEFKNVFGTAPHSALVEPLP
jgi:hypothetical protein